MKRRLLVILTIMVMMCCMPLAVSAAGTEHHVGTGDEFWNSWDAAIKDGGTVVLDRDVSIEWNGYVLKDRNNITIDLNGHCIKGVGKDAEYIFRVTDKAKLTIDDSAGGGYIQITKITGKYKAVIAVDDDDAELVLNKGTLKGNTDTKTRVVYVEDGKFTMNGGAVRDNVYEGWGSGVFIDEGSFVMNGGEICYNTANNQDDYNGCGGGIYYDGGSSTVFEMKGGAIHHNTAEVSGGGIYFDDGGKYTTVGSGKAVLSGGKISDNEANYGAGIYMSDNSDGVELEGTLVITNNWSAEKQGGGVYVHRQDPWISDSTAIIGGSVQIYGNGANGATDVFCDPQYDAIEIKSDIDTSPDSHAWVGVASSFCNFPMDRDQTYTDYKFNESADDKDYSVCFFGGEAYASDTLSEYKKVQKLLVLKDGRDTPVFVLTHNTREMDTANLNYEALVDRDGNRVSGVNYRVESDKTRRVITIDSSVGFLLNDESMLLYSKSGQCKNITLEQMDKTRDEKAKQTVYTLYYLCEFEKTEGDKTYYKNYYQTVVIKVDDHAVKFDMNGHGTATIADQTVGDGEKASEPEAPEGDTGDYFRGWYTDPECTEKYDFDEPVTEDIKLYAGWASIGPPPLACLVKFDMNGHGDQLDPQTVAAGFKADEPDPAPSADGWTFNGWYADQECTDAWSFDTDTVNTDTTLYAKWTQDKPTPAGGPYTVTFIMNGHGDQIAAQSVNKDGHASRPENPTDEEWTFVNWFTDKDCTAEFSFSTPITADTTLYAKWTADTITYDVTFTGNFDGSTYSEDVPQTYGQKYMLPEKNPEREGYSFAGWYTETQFGEKVTADTTVSKKSSHKLYAQWKSISQATCTPPDPIEGLEYTGNPQKIAYAGSAKGGTMQYVVLRENGSKPGTITWSDTIDQPTDSGKYYVYYYVDGDDYHTDLGNKDELDDKYRIEVEIAQIEPPYTAPQLKENLIANGDPQELVAAGSTVEKATMKYALTTGADDPVGDGDWSIEIPKATDAGTYYVHYFVEADKDDVNYKNTKPEVLETRILAAGTEFTVIYNMNGYGAQVDPETVGPGEKVTEPAEPSADKMTFKGWFMEPECVNEWDFDNYTVSGNMTLYAGWEGNFATVTAPPQAHDLTYNGDPLVLADEGAAEGGSMKYAVTDSEEVPDKSAFKNSVDTGTNAGKYYIHFYAAGDEDHADSPISCVRAEIKKMDIAGFTEPEARTGLVYDGTKQKLVTPGSSEYGTVYYALSRTESVPESGWSAKVPKAKKAGQYYVFYYVKGDNNHNDTSIKHVSVVIEKSSSPAGPGGTDTGDEKNVLIYGIAMLLALAGIGIAGRLRRKH